MSSFDPQYRLTSLPGSLTVTLYRISQAVSLLLRDTGQAHGLSPAQVQALLFLAYARHRACTIGGLAERLGCTPSTASGVADALERKGLAVRERWPEHRRTVILRLTCDGAALADKVDNSLEELESIVRELPEAVQNQMLQSIGSIERGLVERGRIKAFDTCWRCRWFQPDAHPEHLDGIHHCGLMDAAVLDADAVKECPDYAPLVKSGQFNVRPILQTELDE